MALLPPCGYELTLQNTKLIISGQIALDWKVFGCRSLFSCPFFVNRVKKKNFMNTDKQKLICHTDEFYI